MAEVKVGLGTVLGDIDLTVLIGAHGAGVNIDIGVELLSRDLQPPCLEQPAQRGGGDALAEAGYNAARYKDVFRPFHILLLPSEPGNRIVVQVDLFTYHRCGLCSPPPRGARAAYP